MDYQEYPKVLRHPARKPARKIAEAIPAKPPGDFGTPEQWEPQRWPDVFVETAAQEEEYVAKGYVPAGQSNPAAFSTAHASPFVAGRTTSEYPKMVNGVMVNDPNAAPSGPLQYPKYVTPKGATEAVLVASAAEEERVMGPPPEPEVSLCREAVAGDFGPGNSDPEDDEEEGDMASSGARTLKLKKSEQRASR